MNDDLQLKWSARQISDAVQSIVEYLQYLLIVMICLFGCMFYIVLAIN